MEDRVQSSWASLATDMTSNPFHQEGVERIWVFMVLDL